MENPTVTGKGDPAAPLQNPSDVTLKLRND